jgi:hypothetical protein
VQRAHNPIHPELGVQSYTILFQEGVEYPYRKLDNIHRVGYDPYFKHGRSEGFTSEEEFNKYFEIIDPTKNISEQ